MLVLTYVRPHDLNGLHDELLAAGLTPAIVEDTSISDTFTLAFETFDPTAAGAIVERANIQTKADTVVAAHDLTAILAARQAAASAAQTALAETVAAKSDLATSYQAAQSALDQILGATSMTNAQLFSAVQAEARILKRTLRLLKDALT